MTAASSGAAVDPATEPSAPTHEATTVLEVPVASISTLSADDHSIAIARHVDENSNATPSTFKFSKDAAEFVPRGASSPDTTMFEFNPGAAEFQPSPTSNENRDPSRPSSISSPLSSPHSGPATAYALPVASMGMYPVMAVQAFRAGADGRGTFAYVAPISATGVVSPMGTGAVGFHSPTFQGSSPTQGNAPSGGWPDTRGKGGGQAHRVMVPRGQQAAAYYQAGGAAAGWNASKQYSEEGGNWHANHQQSQGWRQGTDEVEGGGKADVESATYEGEEETKDEAKEEEELDDGEPKAKSWADIAREAKAKSARALPKRVTKARQGAPLAVTSKPESFGFMPKSPSSCSGDAEVESVENCDLPMPQAAHVAQREQPPPIVVATAAADDGPNTNTSLADRLVQKATSPAASSPALEAPTAELETKPAGLADVASLGVASEDAPQNVSGKGEVCMDGNHATSKGLSVITDFQDEEQDSEVEVEGNDENGADEKCDTEEAKHFGEVEPREREDKLLADSPAVEPIPRREAAENDDEEPGIVHNSSAKSGGARNDFAQEAAQAQENKKDEDEDDDDAVYVPPRDGLPTASLKLASELGKPVGNGVIRYSVDMLKSMASLPGSQGSCPANIPQCLRSSKDGDVPDEAAALTRKRYKMEFLMQFEHKAPCQEPPANNQIPKDLRADVGPLQRQSSYEEEHGDEDGDWRSQSAKHQAQMKRSRDRDGKAPVRGSGGGRSTPGSSGKFGRNAEVLHPSENSWATQQKASRDSDEVVIRKMKGILNKLTVEKFDTLYQQLLDCGIETKEHIESLMREVFEKATTQHHFIEMYTCLCIKLNSWLSDENAVRFKKILLNQCQDSFEKYLKPPEGIQDLGDDEQYEAKVKYKTKMLGNMKFVGQLLIHKVLSSKIIFSCTDELLFYSSEETLETLCVFLVTIGPTYDSKEWRSYDALNAIFARVKDLSTSKAIPARLRCLLKDVVDLRANGWARKARSNEPEGPMRMAEVKSQWAKDMSGQAASEKWGERGRTQDAWPGAFEVVGSRRQTGGKTPSGGSNAPLLRSTSSQMPSTPSRESREGGSRAKAAPAKEWKRAGTAPVSATDVSKTSAPARQEKSLLERTMDAPRLSPSGSLSSSARASGGDEVALVKDFEEEVQGLLAELAASHDLPEAQLRVEELRILRRQQKDFVAALVACAVEYSTSTRPTLWKFAAQLCAKGVIQRQAFVEGLEIFMSSRYEDIIMDVPQLPNILVEELLSALEAGDGGVAVSSDFAGIRERIQQAV